MGPTALDADCMNGLTGVMHSRRPTGFMLVLTIAGFAVAGVPTSLICVGPSTAYTPSSVSTSTKRRSSTPPWTEIEGRSFSTAVDFKTAVGQRHSSWFALPDAD